ncbi:MAG: D-glycerate dehydrogenase [Candidatus Cloacimonetes bacterium HGW-Cloacimonetes-1]|nr:MAG: D-glycerate dehydrogenase [Candidatus Cloacimonetes bacterium HGW-Cloacimonetes-1]
MKYKALITRALPDAAQQKLSEVFDLVINPHDRALTHDEIILQIADCDALICLLTDTIDKAVIDAAPRLKAICNYAVGYNNIDVEYATAKGIVVCNTPGVLTESTADLAWALLMSAARRIVEGDQMMRRGEFPGWEPLMLLGNDVWGKTIGIIGMGRIGQAMARRAGGFGMKVLYSGSAAKALDFPATYCDLDSLLQQSDFISIHAPLTVQTRHMIGTPQFEQMKDTAVLINTARGAIINEAELVLALQNKTISAAGLDVYEREPALAQGLAALPNVVLAPHIGSASIDTRTRMAIMTAENAIAVILGQEPIARVN